MSRPAARAAVSLPAEPVKTNREPAQWTGTGFGPSDGVVASPALSARRTRSLGIVAGVAATLVLSACGGGQNQAASEPAGKFPVSVDTASFPATQRLSQHTHLVLTVRNAGHQAIPNVAVTICNVTCAYPAPEGQGSSSQAFAADINQAYLANPSRPLWIVDRGPGACGYSCRNGGPGAGVTAYSNTWALGRLAPGHSVRFDWAVTAVVAGRHRLAWEIAAGLNGKASAVLANGARPHGTFAVDVGRAPAQSYVNNDGQIVTTGQ